MSSSLDRMKQRASYTGYDLHDKMLVEGKYKSFKSALTMSYQAEWITFNGEKYRCLINPDKISTDYDQKEISIDFDAGLSVGKTFLWNRTNTHWIVFLERYEEEAYFRANIRKCDYQINDYWIWFRGPVETALIWKEKHDIAFNEMNYSGMFYIEKNDETSEYFERLKVIKFEGHNWRVVAVDRYSQPGLIEVYLEEYYDNELEDDMIIPEIIKPDQEQPYIEGPQELKPFDYEINYSAIGLTGGEFVVNSNKVKITKMNDTSCELEILTGKALNFTLSYKVGEAVAAQLEIRVNSI